jgi:hypothetical protein
VIPLSEKMKALNLIRKINIPSIKVVKISGKE